MSEGKREVPKQLIWDGTEDPNGLTDQDGKSLDNQSLDEFLAIMRVMIDRYNSHEQLVGAVKGVGHYLAAVVHYATLEQAKDWGKKHLKHVGEVLKTAGEEV